MIDLSTPQSGVIGAGFWFSDLCLAAIQEHFTGGILLKGPSGDMVAFFRSGQPLHVGGPGFGTHYLGEILVRTSACTEEELERALETQQTHPGRPLLGSCLVTLGVDVAEVKNAVREQTASRLQELLGASNVPWQAAPGESARVRDIGVPVDGWLILLKGIIEHAPDEEMKQLADRLLGSAVCLQKDARLPDFIQDEEVQRLLRYLEKPRKPDQLERALAKRRLVRGLLKILQGLGALEVMPVAKAIPIPKATLLKGVSFGVPTDASNAQTLKGTTEGGATYPSATSVSAGTWGASGTLGTSGKQPSAYPTPKAAADKALEDEIRGFHTEMANQNHFEVLGVKRETDDALVRKNFTRLAKKYHPDGFASTTSVKTLEMIREISARINEAYEVLSDPQRRKQYITLLDDKRIKGDERRASRIKDAEVKSQMGLVMLRKKDFKKAREFLNYAMEGDPDNALYRAHYAWALFADPSSDREEVIEKAYGMLVESLKDAGKDSTVHFYVGQVLKAQNRLKEALQHFKTAESLDSRNVDAIREIRLLSSRLDKADDQKDKKGAISKLFKR